MFPTDIGNLVTYYLTNHFEGIMDYHFTARVEKQFDDIAEGKLQWNNMIAGFYGPFHVTIDKAYERQEKVKGERLLGVDPVSGKNVYVKLGRFGAMVQLGETNDEKGQKPRFAGLRKGQNMESLTLEEALDLLKLPRVVGLIDGKEVVAAIGRFGPYLSFDKAFYSIPAGDDPALVSLERAKEIMEEKKKKASEKIIRTYEDRPDVIVQNGRYGPYISIGKQNIPIPRKTEAATLTLEDCLALAEKYLEAKADNPSPKTTKTRKAPARKPKKS
mgnify:CR=1 FL=1